MKEKIKKSKDEAKGKLRRLAVGASQEDEAGAFMDPIKKRAGRPKGSRNKPKDLPDDGPAPLENEQEKINQLKPLVKPVWEVASNVGQKLAEDERAAIGPEELGILVDCSAACIHQYLPDVVGTHANALVLAVTFGQWATRVWMLRHLKIEELKAQRLAKAEAQTATATVN